MTHRPHKLVHVVPLALLVLSTPPAAAGAAPAAAPRRPDVVLVTIDTLRWDHVGAYGGKTPTPTLDAIAKAGTRFERAYSVAPITLVSHSSIMTGRYPFHHGVRANGFYRLAAEEVTLAERLKAAGYATAAFVSGFPLDSRFGLAQGFDTYDDSFTHFEGGGSAFEAERPASATIDATLAALPKLPHPSFLWVHLYDPHAEYEPPEPFGTRFRPDPYSGEIAYTDHELGRLVDALRARGLDRTLLVVAADHGESLGEHGEKTHTIFVYDATVRVPLLAAGAGVKAGQVVTETVSLADVAPTILGWLGRAAGAGMDGIDLGPALAGRAPPPRRPVYFESYAPRLEFGWSQLLGIVSGTLKYIRAPTPELYDLAADRGEQHNLADSRQPDARRIATELDGLLGGAGVGAESRGEALDAEAVALLQSLGYVESSDAPAPIDGDVSALPDPKVMITSQTLVDNAIRLLHRGRAREAAESLERVLEKDPGNAFARQLLSGARLGLGDPEGALAAIRAGFRHAAPLTESALHATAGDLLRRTGRLAESEKELRLALALDGGNLQAMDVLGLTLLAANEPAEAEAMLQRALRLSPDHARTLCALAEVALAQRRLADARRLFESARTDPAIEPRALFGQAVAARLDGKPEVARAALGSLADLPADREVDAETLQQAGTLAADEGDLDLAIRLFERGRAFSPNDPKLLGDLGVALSRAGRFDAALEHLAEARRLAPRDAALANAMGTALARAGRFSAAVTAFEDALRIDPSNALAAENLTAARTAAAGE